MVNAYLALIYYAYYDDTANTWFCFLTESCVPIVSPDVFRLRFFQYADKTIIHLKKAWWNTAFHTRANLSYLPKPMHLANDPWFIMTRSHADQFMRFRKNNPELYSLICRGGLANESIFAIVFYYYKQIQVLIHDGNQYRPHNHNGSIIWKSSTIANWQRMSSATSPYVFKTGDKYEMDFIEQNMKRNPYAMFLRKVDSEFPDSILLDLIENKNPMWIVNFLCFYYHYKMWLYAFGFFLFFMSFVLWIPWIEALNHFPDL
jgi:hypothetical protein